ncbi:MAG: hypothetical protein KatS3mg015_1545 [Fimbriimonadales bacterium]|nr:MAG: hypothetical protein KatS3mg015_1545 [Fimbriimonadales bacterium]
MTRTQKRFIFGGLGLALVAFLAYAIFFRVPSPEEVGRDALAAVEAGDGRQLLKLLTEEEISGLGLNEQNLSCLLRTLYGPYVRAELRKGAVVLEPNPSMGVVFVRQPYRLPDGGDWHGLGVNVTTGGGRPKVVSAVRALINQRIGLELSRLAEEQRADKREANARLFEQLAPELEKCGLRGMPRRDAVSNVYSVEPWNQYIARLRGPRS